MRLRAKLVSCVRLVVAERKAGGLGERPGLIAGQRQERAHDAAGARAEAEQGPAPGRRGETVDDGLGDIGAGVPGGDPARACANPKALGRHVAGGSGCGLQVAGSELVRTEAFDVQVDAQRRAEPADDALIVVGGVAKPVVHVQRVKVLGADHPDQRGRGAGRIGAARDHDDAVGAGLGQA